MFFHGVNYTSEHGAIYGSEASLTQLKKLPRFGIDAIALVPYAATRPGSSTVRWQGMRMEPAEGIEALARAASGMGLQVMIKPQVWVPGSFTGDLTFPSPAAQNAWFTDYSAYVLHFAALASRVRATLFCAGNEFVKLRDAEQWPALIAQIRKMYGGAVTYAATQGEEFEQLKFWNLVDYIGLNNYYPLPDSLDCSGVAARVDAVIARFRKPLLFTECGYASLEAPHRAPWDETRRKLSPEDQARCYEALLKRFYGHPNVRGFFWWKVGTNGFGGPEDGSHTPWGKPAMDVMARWYRSRTRR
jgi:hypothetical protein